MVVTAIIDARKTLVEETPEMNKKTTLYGYILPISSKVYLYMCPSTYCLHWPCCAHLEWEIKNISKTQRINRKIKNTKR